MKMTRSDIHRLATQGGHLFSLIGIPWLVIALLLGGPVAAPVLITCAGMICDRLADTLAARSTTLPSEEMS